MRYSKHAIHLKMLYTASILLYIMLRIIMYILRTIIIIVLRINVHYSNNETIYNILSCIACLGYLT